MGWEVKPLCKRVLERDRFQMMAALGAVASPRGEAALSACQGAADSAGDPEGWDRATLVSHPPSALDCGQVQPSPRNGSVSLHWQGGILKTECSMGPFLGPLCRAHDSSSFMIIYIDQIFGGGIIS